MIWDARVEEVELELTGACAVHHKVASSWAGGGAGRTSVAGLKLVEHQDMVAILVAQAGAEAKTQVYLSSLPSHQAGPRRGRRDLHQEGPVKCFGKSKAN
eukprot:385174-Prorocentrum_minimum.AAC.4